jgi:hypothetical protein
VDALLQRAAVPVPSVEGGAVMAFAQGTLICSQCLEEFDVTGEITQSIDKHGLLITELEPDVASTAILQAHRCEPKP